MCDARAAVAILRSEGLVVERDGALRTTRRWQAAMMRAASRLVQDGVTGGDLRLPVALALVEIFQDEQRDDVVLAMVAVLTPIELLELEPQRRAEPPRSPTVIQTR